MEVVVVSIVCSLDWEQSINNGYKVFIRDGPELWDLIRGTEKVQGEGDAKLVA